uniref:Mitochondrial pyruvate carrier n=1 Tax=Rhodotorula toruloides TaxID=5286 RepID=A0A0K3CHG5_RHOTO
MAAPAAASSGVSSKLTQLWNSPAGATVFFWAPMFKWGLVAAGLKDLSRPAEVISIPQNLALTATGLIWVRYSFVITPVNYSLAAVNAFVAGTGITSLYRAFDWQRKSPEEQAKVRLEYAEAQKTKDAAKALAA